MNGVVLGVVGTPYVLADDGCVMDIGSEMLSMPIADSVNFFLVIGSLL